MSMFFSGRVGTVKYGSESLAFLVPKLWELVPNDIKSLDFLTAFKSAIKTDLFPISAM